MHTHLSFVNLQCFHALDQEPWIWENNVFVHMLQAVPCLHNIKSKKKCHVNIL